MSVTTSALGLSVGKGKGLLRGSGGRPVDGMIIVRSRTIFLVGGSLLLGLRGSGSLDDELVDGWNSICLAGSTVLSGILPVALQWVWSRSFCRKSL